MTCCKLSCGHMLLNMWLNCRPTVTFPASWRTWWLTVGWVVDRCCSTSDWTGRNSSRPLHTTWVHSVSAYRPHSLSRETSRPPRQTEETSQHRHRRGLGIDRRAALCSRSRDSYISRSLLERLPRTSQTTVAFCRTLVVAHCAPTPMTFGNCSCHEHITNSVIGVSRPPVLDCGTTFHLDSGGRDWPSTPSDQLWNLIYFKTEALSDSIEFISAVRNKQIHLSIYTQTGPIVD